MKLHLLLAVILCLLLVAHAEEDDDKGKYLLSSSVFLFWLRNEEGLVYFVFSVLIIVNSDIMRNILPHFVIFDAV